MLDAVEATGRPAPRGRRIMVRGVVESWIRMDGRRSPANRLPLAVHGTVLTGMPEDPAAALNRLYAEVDRIRAKPEPNGTQSMAVDHDGIVKRFKISMGAGTRPDTITTNGIHLTREKRPVMTMTPPATSLTSPSAVTSWT